ncbi:conjugal transfer protein [Phenylobacterium deserti]|uniref:Conjugal transfer protein n=1 Tax=Phenylobacterium deserti TaxID=1914756 RepID=A0A328AEQ3_9CAUL|nr:conjugal transfer protein [Phenylobacterium deserti]
MPRRRPLGYFASLTLAALLAAAPPAAASDPRIRTLDYQPDKVVALTAAPRTALQVQFPAGETVRHVAAGDGAAWDVAVEGGALFLRPTAPAAAGNLLVATARADGILRHYAFSLRTATPAKAGAPLYVVRFQDPQADALRKAAAAADRLSELADLALAARLEHGAVEGPRNLAYERQGPESLAPAEVSDNGRFTVLRFAGAQALPAVYTVGPDGAEALARFDVRGDRLVVHGVAAQLRLRRGRQALCLFNLAWRPEAAPTPTGTAAREVVRTLKGLAP